MSRITEILALGFGRNTRRRPVDRRRRFGVESLEGRQLMSVDLSSAFGVGGIVNVQRIALDSQGDTLVSGSFRGRVSFDANSAGGNVLDAGANQNGFVAKYSPNNTLLFVKQFVAAPGGSVSPEGIAVDKNTGSIYVTGFFSGTADFDPGGNTLNLTSAGDNDGFVVKLTANGDLDSGLAKRFGGAGSDTPIGLSLDKSGTNLYIAGSFVNTANFDPGGTNKTLTSAAANQPDAFVLKLSSNLAFGFAAQAGLANASGSDAAVDSQGSVYLVGSTTPGAGNAFVAKYNATGNLATEKLYGGPVSGGGFALASSVVVDSSDNVYIGGTFTGTGVNFNKFNGPGTVALDSAGSADAYVIKIDPSVSLVFARRFGSNKSDFGNDLGIDANNNVYLAGFESGQSSFGTTGQGQMVLDTGNGMTGVLNAFVLEVDSTGGFVAAKGPSGGSGQSVPQGIAVDAAGNVAIAGSYTPSVTFGTSTLGALGTSQFFVAHGGGGTGGNNNNGNNNNGNNNGGGTTTAAPTFLGATRVITGKGRHKVITLKLNFSGPLDPATAGVASHYLLTQPGRKHTMTPVPVLSASLGSGNTSVTLTIGKIKAGKPLNLTAMGLTAPGNVAIATINTTV
jgi:hypothetical protein